MVREETIYLIVSPRKGCGLSARAVARPPRLAADEVAMSVTLKVPDAIFKRPSLHATVEIPADLVSRPVIDATVTDTIRQELQRTLGVDLAVSLVEVGTAV